ncbi:MAG: hypothetical protein C4563_03890 [Desulfobulbus sp.]|nr:MAG: hypothetical protein C4563_03890 [Desulfobulbus sp.]
MFDFKLKNKTRRRDRGEIKQPPDPAKTARSLLPGRAMNAPLFPSFMNFANLSENQVVDKCEAKILSHNTGEGKKVIIMDIRTDSRILTADRQ